MVNTTGPYGSVTYGADANAPGGYSQTTTLSPQQQQLLNASTGIQSQALGVGSQQIGRVEQALGNGLAPPTLQGSAPGAGQIQTGFRSQSALADPYSTPAFQQSFNPGQQIQQDYAGGGPIQGGVGNSAVQHQVGPTDFTADRNAITDNVWQQAVSRLNPMYGQRQTALDTRLANQGIGLNSAAFGNAQDIEGRGRNDAYNQALFGAINQGANEQNTLFGQNLAQGNFANAAAGQEFGQGLQQGAFANQAQAQQYAQNQGQAQFHNAAAGQQFGQNQGLAQFANQAAQSSENKALERAQFHNQAIGQDYSQNMGAAQFANQAQGQQFGQNLQAAQFGNEAAQQGFQNQAYAQSQPINNLSALLGLSQVQGPQGINYTPTQVGQTDVIGANALSAQAAQAAYNSQMQNQSSLLGGLAQLGGAAITRYSDRRLKSDVVRIGTRPDGLGVYSYRYTGSTARQVGVMAQEVAQKRPEAVRRIGPWLAVDYSLLEAA